MYILSVANQIKNVFLYAWENKSYRRFIIYAIVLTCVFMYVTKSMNSLMRRDRINPPTFISEFISNMYAEENAQYEERMANYRSRQEQEALTQLQFHHELQQRLEQGNGNKGGNEGKRDSTSQRGNAQVSERNANQALGNAVVQDANTKQQIQELLKLQQEQRRQTPATNRGGRKTTYMPLNALVMIIQLISISAICCLIVFLIYRKFTADNVPPLPILSSKGKLNDEF